MTDHSRAQAAAEPPNPETAAAQKGITFETDKRVDLAFALVVFGVGAFIVWEASSFRIGSFPDPVTARGLPYATGGFMMLGALVIAVRRLRTWNIHQGKYTVTEGAPDEPGQEASALRAYTMMGLAFALIALLPTLGFLITTPLALLAMLWTMGVRGPGKLVGFPLGFTAVIWVAFAQVLGVVLPLGPLAVLARSWGLTP